MGYLLILLKTFFNQAETMIVKKYGQKHQIGGMFFNAVICLFSMIFFFITDKDGLYFPKELWSYGLISCVLFAAGFYYMYAALKVGSFAITKMFTSFTVIVTIVYGIVVLKESANLLTYVSIALILVSIFFMNFNNIDKSSDDNKKSFSVKWLIYVIIVFAANGFIGVLQRAQQIRFDAKCDNEFMIISLAGAFLGLTIIGLILERERLGYIVKHGTVYGMCAGIFNGASNFTGMLVLLCLPISISSPVSTGVGMIANFAISIIIYKEKFSKMQLLSAVMGLTAVVLLKVSELI